MKQIKICFISTNVYPLFNEKTDAIHGGSELQLYLLSKELSKSTDFDISFVVGDFGQKKVEVFDGINLYRSITPNKSDSMVIKLFHALKYICLFKKINADIYFTSAANSTVGLVSFFCKISNKKHIHRTANELEANLTYLKKGLLGIIFVKGLESSDLVITQNETHKKLLKKNHGINAKVLKNSFILKEYVIGEKNSILWVSRCEEFKQPEMFLELSKRFPDEKFLMIAPPANEKEKYQKSLKEKANNVKNLTFISRVPFAEIQKYFNDSKIFINTSIYEGFPNTFLQAGIGKTPILSLNVNPDNFISEYNCGFFCENSFDKLVEYMKILINNKQVWNEKSKNVLKYTEEQHDIHKNVEQLTNWIYNLVNHTT